MANKHLVFWICVFGVFLLDRITKSIVKLYVSPGSSVDFSFFSIVHVYNTGTFFGLFKSASLFFILFAVAVSIFIIVKYSSFDLKYVPLLGFVVGGALGNVLDRLLYGAVLDFFDIHFWPVFNVADSAISISVVLLLVFEFFSKRKI